MATTFSLTANATACAIVDAIRNGQSGGTFDAYNGQAQTFDFGFIVGGMVPSLTIALDDFADYASSVDKIALFVDASPLRYVGFWVNDAVVYVDVVKHCSDVFDALALAEINGELAIHDCANENYIATASQFYFVNRVPQWSQIDALADSLHENETALSYIVRDVHNFDRDDDVTEMYVVQTTVNNLVKLQNGVDAILTIIGQ